MVVGYLRGSRGVCDVRETMGSEDGEYGWLWGQRGKKVGGVEVCGSELVSRCDFDSLAREAVD
jgi:hypothetical protein